jgi:drug/metabolite transporter (DMT)-like permease
MTRRQGVAALVFIAIVWGCCFTLIKQTLELIGMYFLTRPGGMSAGINLGDVLTVACAVLFAFHIVAAGHYASTGRPERLLALELALTGGLSALAAPVLETPRFVLGPATLPAVGFLGVTAAVTFYL